MKSNNHDGEMAFTQEIAPSSSELDTLIKAVLPIWAGQVSVVRGITDEAITGLSARFYGLSQRIQSTVDSSTNSNTSSGGLVSLLEESKSELSSIIQLLSASVEEKKALVNAVLSLSDFAKELKKWRITSV